ncbi:MAG: orotidine-5'-phosphate decarboxylase [Rhodobacteraceae bacterium]|nr:orotidine-5'-phosphate decarboxylase [Paracoccaceae bacterium]
MNKRIIVALDYRHCEEALQLVNEIGDSINFYKVGMSLLANGGLELCQELKSQYSKRVFLDLKLFDIANTISEAIKNLAALNLDFLTVHGDPHIVEAAVKGRGLSSTKILAVTVLTSMDRNDLDNSLCTQGSVEEIVLKRAERALSAGADGVIASPNEVDLIRSSHLSKKKLIVTPGIRLSSSSHDDQKRVSTPEQAIQAGADYLVVGRAITSARNPALMIERIISSISS